MPDISNYDNEQDWMKVCVPKMMNEGKPNEQAVAICMSQWADKADAAKYRALFTEAVKAVGDWELDVKPVPFNRPDSDQQWFDENTDIMENAFQTPLIVYQHGIKQGAKSIDGKPVIVGKAVPGSLEKKSDGWHIRVILDKAVKQAKDIMEAAKRGLVAVSSGSIAHLARLDVNGKLIQYEKTRPGRIAVWGLAEISLWEMGGGNVRPASQFAVALPAMKAMYKVAGIKFPEIDTHGAPEAEEVKRRAKVEEVKKNARTILQRLENSGDK